MNEKDECSSVVVGQLTEGKPYPSWARVSHRTWSICNPCWNMRRNIGSAEPVESIPSAGRTSAHWNGTVGSLACQSCYPHHYPNRHAKAELKLIQEKRCHNPSLGMVELWHRLCQRSTLNVPKVCFGSCVNFVCSLRRRRKYPSSQNLINRWHSWPKNPGRCEDGSAPSYRLSRAALQYTAIDELTCLRILAAYPEQYTYSSADFFQTNSLSNMFKQTYKKLSVYRLFLLTF